MFSSVAVFRRCLALVFVACLLAPIIGSAGTTAQEAVESGFTGQDVVDRNELIASQESLLNVYRCRFSVDTEIVPDGCVDGQPAQGATEPDQFEATPTENDITVRDNLISAQESLLNDYRCLFRIDMNIVPGGCHRLAIVSQSAIWTMHGDGTDLVELVVAPESEDPNGHNSIDAISWSPDGKHIAYSLTQISQEEPVRGQIWIVSSDGSEHTLVLETKEHAYAVLNQITWSPDGLQIFYVFHCCDLLSNNIPSALWKINIDGTDRTRLTDGNGYSWSPDRTQIVYKRVIERTLSNRESYWVGQVWTMDAAGNNRRKIREHGTSFGPVWSPDGSRIAVEVISTSVDGDRYKELSAFNAQGRHNRLLDNVTYELANPNDSQPTGFSWSPDSDQIAYIDYKDKENVLTLVGVDGSSKRHLASLGRPSTFPVWSLDGTRIAFAPATVEPYKNGNLYTGGGLWTINPEGTILRRLTPQDWLITDIAWSPRR